MTTQYKYDDLKSYYEADQATSAAYYAMMDKIHDDRASLDRAYQHWRVRLMQQKAAGMVLGLDPDASHPIILRSIDEQSAEAGLTRHKATLARLAREAKAKAKTQIKIEKNA